MATGKALVITASGGTDVFQINPAFDFQAPMEGEVLVKLVATSVNPVDVYVRTGAYASPTFPKVIGGDLAGHVFSLGPGSNKFSVGDAVYALSDTYVPYSKYEGTYAEYAVVKEEWLANAPVADRLSLVSSAGVPLVYLTALQALEKAEPKAGQRILVLGASGGVGQFGVQLAKLVYSLHVTAASSVKNAELVKSLGADEVWDYSAGPAGLEATYGSAPFDIIFDVVGGELLDASAKVLAAGGVITHIMNRGTNGADKTYRESFEAGTGPKFETTLVKPDGKGLEEATKLFNVGKITMKVALELPLEEAGKAHDIVIDGHAGGKVVLTI